MYRVQHIFETFLWFDRIVSMMDESKLIEEVIAGADRFEELVRRYHVGLIIHCEGLVGDRDAAEDIAQEAFVKAYFDLEKFDPNKARFSTWLYRIATNKAIDYLRQQKRRVSVEDIESIAEATMPAYIEEEQKQEIRQAVLKLVPPKYRQVIEAYYWDGKSYEQIAHDMDIQLNTVRTWLRRAKLQLKEELK